MKRIVHVLVTAAVVLGLAATTATTASAAAPPGKSVLTASERAQITDFFDTYAVPVKTQKALFAKLDAGQLWDSMAGVDAVAQRTVDVAGAVENVATYADGSVSVTSLETPAAQATGGIQPMSVSGCSMTGGLTRTMKNCKVTMTTGLVTMGFYADYTYSYFSYEDIWITDASIQRVFSPSATVIGGTFTDLSTSIPFPVATSGVPAIARASMTASVAGGWAGRTCWLQLNVPIGSYSLAYSSASF